MTSRIKKSSLLDSYDIKVLIALNKIQNSDCVKKEELTSWIIMKKLTPQARELENSYVLASLKKLNKLGLIDLHIEDLKNKIRRTWILNCSKVLFKNNKFPNGIKKSVVCNIDGKWLAREI